MPLSNLFRGLKGRKINFLIIKKIGCRGISLQGLEIGILQWSIHPRIPSILFCRNLTDNPKPSCSQRVTEFFKNTVGKGCVIDLFIYLFIFYYISDSSHPSIHQFYLVFIRLYLVFILIQELELIYVTIKTYLCLYVYLTYT